LGAPNSWNFLASDAVETATTAVPIVTHLPKRIGTLAPSLLLLISQSAAIESMFR
jgi:hypothetical protein